VGEGVGGSAIIARRDDETVEGYNYGGLTFGGGVQALWIFLLPFTVLNTGGWTHDPRPGLGRMQRVVVHALSLALTAWFVFTASVVLVDVAGYQWTRRLACSAPTGACARPGLVAVQWWGLAATLVVLAGFAAGLVVVAGKSQNRFEKVASPAARRASPNGDVPRGASEDLEAETFFWHPASARHLLAWHAAVLAASWLAVAGLVAVRVFHPSPPQALDLYPLVVAAGFPAAVGVGLLWLPWVGALVAAPFRRVRPAVGLAGPAIAATLAYAMVIAFDSGLFLFAVQRLNAWPSRPASVPAITAGNAVSLTDVWGAVLIGAAVAALLLAGWIALHRRTASELPAGQSPPGWPLDGVDPGMRGSVSFARTLAWYAHRAPGIALWLAFGLFLTDVAAYTARSHWFHHLELPPPAHPSQALYTVGSYGLTLLPVVVAGLVRSAESSRTFVYTIWDVLTVLPRRFSPLAVRCYGERAVPELQGRIEYHVTAGRPVLVSAHSEGSVLAVCALAPMGPEVTAMVDLVTYGSPLAGLYRSLFPAYFGTGPVESLQARLRAAAGGDDGWLNFYRLTDPIGGPVLGDAADRLLDDPMQTPFVPTPPDPREAPLEHDRTPWTEVAGHSNYLREPELKQSVAALKESLARR
ncbi:MAG TPA: hypothetical protein VHA57_00860, partial [Actinomycetota bacterium]|nr:hypothetical protein [Actinomycetota bacterium]